MKNLINEVLFGKNSFLGGLIALAVVMAIGLGCFCNKDKFNNLSNTTSTTTTPSPNSTTDATPKPEATKSYKKADASKSELPSDDEMQDIVKKTLLDFNDALQKEDFTDFHKTISKTWQRQITPEKFKESFQGFIDGNTDLSNIKTMKADFTSPNEVTRSSGVKTLETKGTYDTAPVDTQFELKYIPEGKEWKLIGLKVYANIDRN